MRILYQESNAGAGIRADDLRSDSGTHMLAQDQSLTLVLGNLTPSSDEGGDVCCECVVLPLVKKKLLSANSLTEQSQV